MRISDWSSDVCSSDLKSSMISGTAANRAEIRRLVSWFDTQFYGDIVAPLLHERMIKRLVHRATPDARALREAMKAALQHLDYTDYLLDHRHWLGGATMRSEEHTSETQSLMRISYAVLCLNKKNQRQPTNSKS